MATAANSSTAINHSPRLSGGDNLHSPKSRRGAAAPAAAASARTVSPPWTQIVRGGDSEVITAVPSSPSSSVSASVVAVVQEQVVIGSSYDCSPVKPSSPDDSATESSSDSGGGNGNAGKKQAWNKPSSNGAAVEVGPVIDADSWPALSESARAASQKSSSDSLKASSDGSVSVSQGTGTAPSAPKQVTNNANPNSTPNHTVPTRQKSMKRGGVNTPANGGLPQPLAPPGPVVEIPSNNSTNTHRSSNWETGQRGGSGSQSHSGNDHPPQRNSYRRGNGGPHPRGDGSYNHNYGGRQDRANHVWNPQRSFNNRDAHMQPQRVVPRTFIPHGSGPFISPPPVRPHGNPMGFPELPSPVYYISPTPHEPYRGMPFVAAIPPHAMFITPPDPQLHAKLVNQIDYYFSNENLIKDTYLRQNMDDQGWVPVKLIAGFKKVLNLTDNIQLILDAVRISTIVEVQGDKVRKRNDWMRWIMPPSVQVPTNSGSQPLGRSSHDMLAAHVQNITLGEKTSARGQADVHAEAFPSRSSSGDLSSQSQPSSGEGTGQVTVQAGFDRSVLARNSSKRDSC